MNARYCPCFGVNGFVSWDSSATNGDGGQVQTARHPASTEYNLADPPLLGIVNQFAADHVVTVDEDDCLVFRRDLGKRSVLVLDEE